MMYQERETGEVITREEMISRFKECYDGEDPTNAVGLEEYFEEVADTLEERIVEAEEKKDGM